MSRQIYIVMSCNDRTDSVNPVIAYESATKADLKMRELNAQLKGGPIINRVKSIELRS